MNDLTCIIIGGGHVGLHSLKAIKEETRGMANGRRIRFVLIDKQPGHLRKMLLFRPRSAVLRHARPARAADADRTDGFCPA